MKRHAAAGADILSAINFPYPVVPIVRHHHENWDGTGYPDGLRGTDIPIGARILAVVDCFDALTSDRPYRRSLPDNEAMDILMQRRGSMYDPLVVDTFASVKTKLSEEHSRVEEQDAHASLRRKQVEPTESHPAYQPRMVDDDFVKASHTVLSTVQDATSATFAVLFLRDSNVDEAFAVASTSVDETIGGARMALGSGISGWVIANGRAVVNSDAALDFMSLPTKPTVSRCASVPIDVRGETVGALACYLSDTRGFNERDIAVMEKIASTFDKQPLQDLTKKAIASFVRPPIQRSVH
jgi:hypothetical protein